MPANYPLNIAQKEDSPSRVALLEGVDVKHYTSAAEFNKVLAAIEELFTLRPKVTLAGFDFDLYKSSINNDVAKIFTLQRLDVIIGSGPDDNFINAKFIGLAGQEEDLLNPESYEHFGGFAP